MKKSIFIILIAFTVMISCEKSENIISGDLSINEIAVKQVINTENVDLQKNLYKLLTASEKALVWKNKYRILLTNSNLTRSQRSFIEKLEKLVSPEVFINNSAKLKENVKQQEFKAIAISLFGVSGSYYLIASINEEKQYENSLKAQSISETSGLRGPCGCSRTDDWCSYPTTCIGLNCNASGDGGCGWWLSQNCNGDCIDRTWH